MTLALTGILGADGVFRESAPWALITEETELANPNSLSAKFDGLSEAAGPMALLLAA